MSEPKKTASWWTRIKAYFRVDRESVCEASAGRGLVDFHDYPDTAEKIPIHFATLTCERCGKEFTM